MRQPEMYSRRSIGWIQPMPCAEAKHPRVAAERHKAKSHRRTRRWVMHVVSHVLAFGYFCFSSTGHCMA